MNQHNDHDRQSPASRPSKRERLQALLFTAGSIGTALVTLGLLSEVKLPRAQGE
jgi:hypothetical protein